MGSGQLSTRRLSDGRMVIDVRGELDAASAATLRDHLSAEVIAIGPPGVLVDLGLVTFIDDTALSALIGLQHDVSAIGAALRVVNPSPCVARLMQAAGFDEALGRHRGDGG
jgi:anti-sigma B factor antagonist